MQPRVAWLLFCSRLAKSAPPRGGVFRWVNKTQPVLSITLGCLPPPAAVENAGDSTASFERLARLVGYARHPGYVSLLLFLGRKGRKKGVRRASGHGSNHLNSS